VRSFFKYACFLLLCLRLHADEISEVDTVEPAPPVLIESSPSVDDANTGQPENPKTNLEPTVVTSDRLQVDYANNRGTFEGNVLAIDPRITVRADQMIVIFGSETNETKSIERILATGAVVVTQDDRKSTSDYAEYTAGDGKVVLTGKPFVETPQGTVTGEKITFWRGLQKMDVEAGSQLVIYPDQTQSILEKPSERTQ